MKTKLYTAILLLSVCLSVGAQNKLQILPKAAISYAYEKMEIDNEGRFKVRLPNLSVRTGIELKYGKLSAFYDNKFWLEKGNNISFIPRQSKFSIGVSYEIAKNIKISCEHSCYHPMYTSGGDIKGLCGGKSEITLSYGY